MDCYKLIEAVKQKPELWGASQVDFEVSGNRWKKVAEKVGATAEACFNEWIKLRFQYKYYTDPCKDDEVKFEYFEHLQFLNAILPRATNVAKVERDKLELIAKVKERPYLWKLQQQKRNYLKAATLWKEIADLLGLSEQMCIEYWFDLNSKYNYHKAQERKLLGTSNKYNCQWKYYEHLQFLDVVNDPPKKHVTPNIDPLELISNVKERPYLWRTGCGEKDPEILTFLWSEVSKCMGLGVTVALCKQQWNELRFIYAREKRIKKLKQNGVETEEWIYFENMKFLDNSNVDTQRRKRYSKNISSKESMTKLIAEVKKRPFLWKDRSYGSKKLNAYFWSEVADNCNTEVKVCKIKWCRLKMLYKSYIFNLQRQNTKTDVEFLHYFEQLEFLNDIVEESIKYDMTKQNRIYIDGSVDNANACSLSPSFTSTALHNNQNQHLEFQWVEERPVTQLRNTDNEVIQIDSSDSECSNSINETYLCEYDNSAQHLDSKTSPQQITLIVQFKNDADGCVKEEIDVSEISIKTETEIQPQDQAVYQLHKNNLKMEEVDIKVESEVTWDAVQKDYIEFESFVSNWGKNMNGSDNIPIKQEACKDEPSAADFVYENKFSKVDISSNVPKFIKNEEDSDIEIVIDEDVNIIEIN